MDLKTELPQTFDALRQTIRDRFPDLSPHLQRIARASLEEPNTFALNTTQAIAETLEIQPSTLIRFAKEFGYSGFSDLQKVFRQRLIEGEVATRDKVLSQDQMAPKEVADIFTGCIDAHIAALERLRETTDTNTLASAAQMIASSRHVYVAGLRRSRPMADYLVYGLLRMERSSSHLDFAGGMAGPQIGTLTKDDLLVAIAFPPYSNPVINTVMDAHVSGRRVLTITDGPDSPLAKHADTTLFVEADTTSQLQPISGAIGLVHMLLLTMQP